MRLGLSVPILLAVVVSAVGAPARAQGIPLDGFPSWQERTLWVFVNRDRADPETALAHCNDDGGSCPDLMCYMGPRQPLAYNINLAHSARLQPTILVENNVTLMHPSPCLLKSDIAKTYPDECDGGTDCVCQTPVQCSNPPDTQECSCGEDTGDTSKFEDPFARIRMFAPGATTYAENLAAGAPDPQSVESGWLNESCSCCSTFACVSATCPDGTENGHRANLMSTEVNSIGLGAVEAPDSDCFHEPPSGYYWGQDFAFFADAAVLKIVAGSHFPQGGNYCSQPDGGTAQCLTFYANWFDRAGAPSKATVVIGQQSHTMTVDRGSDGNATYAYAAMLPVVTCQSYNFVFTDSSGGGLTLPASGAYQAGDKCTSDYASSGCASGAGEPALLGLLLAAGLLNFQGKSRKRFGSIDARGRKLTK